MSNAATVRASATRSGFTATPHTMTGSVAIHDSARPDATRGPAARARKAIAAAIASVATPLAIRPAMNGSPSPAMWK